MGLGRPLQIFPCDRRGHAPHSGPPNSMLLPGGCARLAPAMVPCDRRPRATWHDAALARGRERARAWESSNNGVASLPAGQWLRACAPKKILREPAAEIWLAVIGFADFIRWPGGWLGQRPLPGSRERPVGLSRTLPFSDVVSLSPENIC